MLAIIETLEMSLVATLIGAVGALPLALVASRNLFGLAGGAAARLFLATVRTIPALLWALIMVVAFGLGPVPGTLGLAVYTVGYLGKFMYEAFEAVDPEVIEAVRGVGCSRAQLIRHAVLPESGNQLVSQILFMFEYNVRASSILGFVGAGGVGFYMFAYIQVLQYRNLMTTILLTLVVVLAIDFASALVRRRFLLEQRRPGGRAMGWLGGLAELMRPRRAGP
jgi:phosphonate transport system permease protein